MGEMEFRSKDGSQLGEHLTEAEICPNELLAGQEEAFAHDMARILAHSSEFVSVVCPACGRDMYTRAFSKSGFEFVRCKECQTIYMSPRPSEAIMADYYANSENYAYWARHIFPASESSRREKIHKPWFARVLECCEKFGVPRNMLLEIGPGFGTFSSVAIDSGVFRRVVAVEPTPELASACRDRGIEVIQKRIEDVGEELEQADVVVAFEVIEHLFEPRRFLEGIRPRMAPAGLLVLSCPNGLGFDIAMLGAGALAVDAEHVNLFNPKSLSRLLADCGFEVLKAWTPGRLDAEFVRDAFIQGKIDLDPFLHRVLVEEWDEHGWPFQQFIAQQYLSSHMWTVSRKPL